MTEKLPRNAFALPRKRKYRIYRLADGMIVPNATLAREAMRQAQSAYARDMLTASELQIVNERARAVLRRCEGRHRPEGKTRAPVRRMPTAGEVRAVCAARLLAALV